MSAVPPIEIPEYAKTAADACDAPKQDEWWKAVKPWGDELTKDINLLIKETVSKKI